VKASIMSIFVLLFASCSMVSNTPIDMPTIFPHRNYVDSLDDYRTVNAIIDYLSPPNYPPNELAAGIEAKVLARITLNEKGSVIHIDFLKSNGSDFNDSVSASIYRSKFRTGIVNDVPVQCQIIKIYQFRIAH